MMLALSSEDYHDSSNKGKPRLPKSQGVQDDKVLDKSVAKDLLGTILIDPRDKRTLGACREPRTVDSKLIEDGINVSNESQTTNAGEFADSPNGIDVAPDEKRKVDDGSSSSQGGSGQLVATKPRSATFPVNINSSRLTADKVLPKITPKRINTTTTNNTTNAANAANAASAASAAAATSGYTHSAPLTTVKSKEFSFFESRDANHNRPTAVVAAAAASAVAVAVAESALVDSDDGEGAAGGGAEKQNPTTLKKDRSNSFESVTSDPKRRLLNGSINGPLTNVPADEHRQHYHPAVPLKSSFSIPNSLDISIEIAKLEDYHRVAKTLVLAFEDDPFTNYILNTSKYDKEITPKPVYKKKKMDLMLSYFEYAAYECLSTDGMILIIKDNHFEKSLVDLDVKLDKFPFLGCALWNQIYGSNISDSSSGSDSDYDDDDYFASGDLSFRDAMHKSCLKFNLKAIRGQCRSKVFKQKLPFLTKVRNEVLIKQLLRKKEDAHHFPCDVDIWYLNDIATLPSMRGKGLGKLLIEYSRTRFSNQNKKSYIYLESSNPANRKFYMKLGFTLMKSYSIKYNKYVDPESVLDKDPTNKAINMDAMLLYP
ncbi:uncharacterized protein LODBEIA_P18290 [Lodderomyces beijingensis]|uniref:N-acetyltransferase domain-containing protein n=1 Tax=Lodderomyces beijingensis TaxID=1775926 RepID=A0ABP0ZMU9_9ASCO